MWLHQLPYCIKQLCDQWSLTDIRPVSNMSYNYVALAIQNKHKPVVLKLSCDSKLVEDEYKALRYFDGAASVRLLDINLQDNAILLTQAIPATNLNSVASQDMEAAIPIYADLVRKIASKPLSAGNFRHVTEWCRAIDRIKKEDIDERLVAKAIQIRSCLLSFMQSEYLCHADLHLDNVLQHQKNWISIDPKGVIGDIAFEASAFDFVKKDEWCKLDAVKSNIIFRINWLAEILKIDKNRLLNWVFLREIISAQWFIEDGGDPEKALKLASTIVV